MAFWLGVTVGAWVFLSVGYLLGLMTNLDHKEVIED